MDDRTSATATADAHGRPTAKKKQAMNLDER
jgi:hypothetical protein